MYWNYRQLIFIITEQSRTLYREVDGVINAKQTRQLRPYASISGPSRSISLETPKAGYLKTNRGFNANINHSAYSKNHVLNSHDEYSIPITSTHNSSTTKKLEYFNHLILLATSSGLLMLALIADKKNDSVMVTTEDFSLKRRVMSVHQAITPVKILILALPRYVFDFTYIVGMYIKRKVYVLKVGIFLGGHYLISQSKICLFLWTVPSQSFQTSQWNKSEPALWSSGRRFYIWIYKWHFRLQTCKKLY